MFGQFGTKKVHIMAQNLTAWIKGQQQPGPISSKESNIWLIFCTSPNVAGGPKASRTACAHRVPRVLPWGEAPCQGEEGSCALWSLAHLSDVMASVASNKFIFWKDIYHTVYSLQDERNPQLLCYPFMLHFVFAWMKKMTENIINQLPLRFPARNIVQISKRDSPWNQSHLTRSRWPACSDRPAPAPRWGSLAFRMSWSTLFLKEYVFKV